MILMITAKTKSRGNAKDWLIQLNRRVYNYESVLRKYGEVGVDALSVATPWDTGKTAMSWSYEIIKENENKYRLQFNNSNIQNGLNIAVILQTGHPTNNGGWVEGREYINEALRPIFDDIARSVWREIKEL